MKQVILILGSFCTLLAFQNCSGKLQSSMMNESVQSSQSAGISQLQEKAILSGQLSLLQGYAVPAPSAPVSSPSTSSIKSAAPISTPCDISGTKSFDSSVTASAGGPTISNINLIYNNCKEIDGGFPTLKNGVHNVQSKSSADRSSELSANADLSTAVDYNGKCSITSKNKISTLLQIKNNSSAVDVTDFAYAGNYQSESSILESNAKSVSAGDLIVNKFAIDLTLKGTETTSILMNATVNGSVNTNSQSVSYSSVITGEYSLCADLKSRATSIKVTTKFNGKTYELRAEIDCNNVSKFYKDGVEVSVDELTSIDAGSICD